MYKTIMQAKKYSLTEARRLLSSFVATVFLSACASTEPNNHEDQHYIDQSEVNTSSADCVVLIHGLWRSAFAMRSIENSLNEAGYQTVNISYPSTSLPIETIADDYVGPAISECRSLSDRTHIVTHSMGGIVARAYLQNNRLPEGGKLVMLSPPNRGSELSMWLHEHSWFHFFVGTAAATLHSDDNGIVPELSEIPEPTGVIAGYREWSLWPQSWLPAPNDGMVSVESMVLEGMDDFVLINTGHAMMRYRDDVQNQIIAFLRNGQFDHIPVTEDLTTPLPEPYTSANASQSH